MQQEVIQLLNPKKVLIIDDDAVMSKLLQHRLNSQNLLTTATSTIREADHHIKLNKPDVILLDILLPGLNGLQFLSYMKFTIEWKNIPVILMSVLGNSEIIETGYKLGAFDFHQKPVAINKLIKSIENCFDSKDTK